MGKTRNYDPSEDSPDACFGGPSGEDSEKGEDEAFFTYKERPLHISDEEEDEDEESDDEFVGLSAKRAAGDGSSSSNAKRRKREAQPAAAQVRPYKPPLIVLQFPSNCVVCCVATRRSQGAMTRRRR